MESRDPQSSLITARPLVLTEKDWKKLNADQRFQARRLYNAGGREMARLYIANITQPKNSEKPADTGVANKLKRALRPFVSGMELRVEDYSKIACINASYAASKLRQMEGQGFLCRKSSGAYSITRHGLKTLGVLKDEF